MTVAYNAGCSGNSLSTLIDIEVSSDIRGTAEEIAAENTCLTQKKWGCEKSIAQKKEGPRVHKSPRSFFYGADVYKRQRHDNPYGIVTGCFA